VTPFSFILKTDLFPITILFLMFHMISFQPRVMLVSGISLFGFNLAMLLFSIVLGGTTADFSEAFTSYRVNIDFEAGKLITFAFIAATVYLVSRRMRKTVYDSAEAEVAATQLGRYFSPNVSRRILSHDASIMEVGGSEYEVAVLFSDIENFTTLSETLAPAEVLHFLSQYHERMLEAIFEHGGTLDKFIGDAIMATFGVPEPGSEDAANAVRAALAMNDALTGLNRERKARGEFEIHHRIGLHYGRVLAGNIGSHRQLEYTVIGDTVNTASRIEGACKQFGRRLLLSEAVVSRAGDALAFEPLGEITVKGRSRPVTLYTVASGSLTG
jgi:adenylate cyclase